MSQKEVNQQEVNQQEPGMTRRTFVKGLAIGAAGLGIAAILPGGVITAAAAGTESKRPDMKNAADGIYIDGLRRRALGAPATNILCLSVRTALLLCGTA